MPQAEIAATNYDLSINRYKQSAQKESIHASPSEIIHELQRIENEILDALASLEVTLI